MECPVCKTELNLTERSGVEIDYCPKCRGIWLDRGELDKIIEKSTAYYGDQEVRRVDKSYDKDRYSDDDYYKRKPGYDDDYYKYNKHKRKKNFFEDLFDF